MRLPCPERTSKTSCSDWKEAERPWMCSERPRLAGLVVECRRLSLLLKKEVAICGPAGCCGTAVSSGLPDVALAATGKFLRSAKCDCS